jgi:endonuclease/exonuclease/phosphatase family metal-dependent hydrolase
MQKAHTMRHVSAKALCLVALMMGAVGCGGFDSFEADHTEEVRRGDLGKADLYGSCSANDTCDGQAADGNCWCDDSCLGHGDCCADKPTACPGGVQMATYNAGLAHGAVPYAVERLEPIIEELREVPADVLCVQEVWTDEDAQAIQSGLAQEFPHAFRERTVNDDSDWFACGITQWAAIYRMNSCVSEQCTPNGISTFECADDQCASQWNDIHDDCKLCLAANATSPVKCAAWQAPMFANGGRNGLMLLSRTPLENPSYTPFETFVVKRGVIRADVEGFQVQCTHMTSALDVVPYPAGAAYDSWDDEHLAQVEVMAEQAGSRRRTVMLGDLNTGPASEGVDAELPENFEALLDAGYGDTWTADQSCTYCQENPLVCSRPEGCGTSVRIDHAMPKNFTDDIALSFERFGDQDVPDVERLSDHYGLIATMPY